MDDILDVSEPLVLLIGTLDSEGIISTLKASARQYKVKKIDSSPNNWSSIVNYFEKYDIRCAVVKLTGMTYEYLSRSEYNEVRDTLLSYLSKVPHAIFAHERLLWGNGGDTLLPINEEEDWDDEEDDRYKQMHLYDSAQKLFDDSLKEYRTLDLYPRLHCPSDEIRNQIHALLMGRGFKILPYTSNAELTVLVSSFITDAEEGLLLRIYIPSGRIWANETDRLIQLFRDYLSGIEKIPVRFDQRRTDRGTFYEFFSASTKSSEISMNKETVATHFDEFFRFLELSVSDPAQAEEILKLKSINPREVVSILTRYAKEAKRLQIDLKHDKEQRSLAILHRCESELVDVFPSNISSDVVAKLVEHFIPDFSSLRSVLKGNQSIQLNAASGSNVTVNISPQIIDAVNSIIAQEIEGDVHLTAPDRELLKLIREHAGNDEQELTSAVRELADDSAPKSSRLFAKEKIKGFLFQAGSKIGEFSLKVLLSYLEKKIGF